MNKTQINSHREVKEITKEIMRDKKNYCFRVNQTNAIESIRDTENQILMVD